MHGSSFDTLTRAFVELRSRRGLGRLLGGLLIAGSLSPLASVATVAKAKKGKKKAKKKAKRRDPVSPPPAFCAAQTEGTPCGECRVCRGGACGAAPDDTACAGDGLCLVGRCNPRPTCAMKGVSCGANGTECCGPCSGGIGMPGSCGASGLRQACLEDDDCAAGLQCVGYACMTTTCAATADYCADGAARCGTGGFCLRPLGGGAARCGEQPLGDLCGCTGHGDCAQYGAGAFCAQDTGGSCGCASGATTFCAVPR